MLRVLHEFDDPTVLGPLGAELASVRDEPGCASAEAYASLVAGEDFYALTMVWQDEAAYDAFWSRALAGSYPTLLGLVAGAAGDDPLDDRAATEFYRQEAFAVRGGRWVPEAADETARRIFWPAAGPVRIIIQYAVDGSDAMYAAIDAEVAETRREEGCLEYAWLENVELPDHLLLLELWADQVVYDRHDALRGATAEFRGPTLRTPIEPTRGPVSREFYRHQEFRHHYDRWMPEDPAAYAQAVVWPAR